jgi:hypothetical protein
VPQRLDAQVGDAREVADREPCCHQAIVNPPLTGQSTAPDSTEVIEHYGDTIVRGRYDGTFDKTNLPDELILTGYPLGSVRARTGRPAF